MAGAWSRRAGHAFGRVGRPCRGRCKYVHVSSVAASMRLTPLHGLPTLPSTVSCGRPPRKKEKKSRSGSRAALARKQTNKKDAANAASFLFSISSSVTHALAHRHRETVGGGAVWVGRTVGAMGPRHASGGLGRTPNPGLAVCAGQRTRARRHRAPRGEGALLAKHCFASARTHSRQRLGRTPEGGARRVLPTRTAPPNPQKPRAALALALDFSL